MINFTLRLAPLMALVVILVSGCSIFGSKESSWETVSVRPMWFATDDQFAVEEVESIYKYRPHLFFDFSPYIDQQDNSVNFVVLTPPGSKSAYGIDLLSGSRFLKHHYCSQSDIWNQFKGDIDYPPFAEGIVPRILDQLGKPQKIFVFGRDDYYKENNGVVSHTVRIVGGVIEEYCPFGDCIERFAWEKRVVLVAVDPNDSTFSDVVDMKQLKTKVDWPYVTAFIQNANGRNFAYGKEFPGFRAIGELSSTEAIKSTLEKSHIFQESELLSIRKSCNKLYEYVWKKFGIEPSTQENKSKIKETFAQAFYDFREKYGRQFQTCTDFVQLPRIEQGSQKHWMFTHFAAFFKLERLGYYYSCVRESWFPNPFKADGKRTYDSSKALKNCLESSMNKAFPYAVTQFRNLKNVNREYYRFVEYDNQVGGTHNKIYSWTPVEYKKLQCEDKKISERNQDQSVFPKDVSWQRILFRSANQLNGYIY